jgi:hypothetical protein
MKKRTWTRADIATREWFTICFIPLIPFSLKPWKEVGCHICNFWQDLRHRPDVEQGHGNVPLQQYAAGGQGPPQQQQYK